MSSEIHTYTVRNDPKVVRQADVAGYRKYWQFWLGQVVSSGVWLGALTGFSYEVTRIWSGQPSVGALPFALSFGFAFGVLRSLITHAYRLTTESNRDSDEVWECTMSQEEWTFRNREGIATIIPWSTMRMVAEIPNAWIIMFGKTAVTVFRKPLREAGLEDDFASRIPNRE